MIPDDEVERVARAMVVEMGIDPDSDAYSPGPCKAWQLWSHEARKLIAFQRAWERVKE